MKLQRTPLRDQIKEELIRRILSGRFKPGDRIKESVIAGEMQTSQAPVREAIRLLEVMGYVEHEPHKGAKIRRLNRQEFIEVYEIREAFEIFAVRSAQNRLKASLKEIKNCLSAMASAADQSDISSHSSHNAKFHRMIVEASGNQAMLKTLDTLAVHEQIAATLTTNKMALDETMALHYPIVEAIESGSWDEVCRHITRHYQEIKDCI